MPLDYLDFDYSEDAEGTGTWDAMACVQPQRLGALHAEITRLLAWAHHTFAGQQGPCEDGGQWDYDLQAQAEDGTPLHIAYDAAHERLHAQAAPSGGRTTVTLSLSGSAAFGEALRDAFGLEP
jgi:hypothetical protein